MKKRYLIHYFDPSVESTLSPIVELDDKEILDYCASLKAKGYVEIQYTHYDQESGAPKNSYIDYPPVKRCPVCGRVPSISYACGECFVQRNPPPCKGSHQQTRHDRKTVPQNAHCSPFLHERCRG